MIFRQGAAIAQWESGPLPNEPERLAAICGLTVNEFMDLWPQLASQLMEDEHGRVYHEPTEARRQKYIGFRARQSEGGRKGMKARWQCPECSFRPFNGRCMACGYEKKPTGNVVPLTNGKSLKG